MQCNLDIPKISGLEDHQLTVGREFYLNCKGDWPKDLKLESLSFKGDANMKYMLKVLGFEFRSPEEADLKVTSYVAAKVQIPQLVLTDGEKNVELGPVQFQVESVLPKPEAGGGMIPGQQQPTKPEPYGPIGPAVIPVPLSYWLLLLGSIAFVALMIALRIWRFNQRREMLLRLKEHDVALSPLQEFHQAMRKLQRANSVFFGKEATGEELHDGMKELSRMFKVFVSRRLRVPAFEWSERLILKDIRRYHPSVYADYAKKLRDLFTEFKKAETTNAKLASGDVIQLSESLRKTLEGIENLMNREETAKKGTR
jgi:hypothetical protein